MRTLKPLELNSYEKKWLSDVIEDICYNEEVKKNCRVILLYNELMDVDKVVEETGLSRRTIFNYVAKYRKDKRFMINQYKKRKRTRLSELENFELQIADDFEKNPITSYQQATLRIKEITGISRSETQIKNFLKKHDFYKNVKGYYVQRQTERVKNKKIISSNTSFLYENKDEIIRYVEDLLKEGDFLIDDVAVMVKENFPLIMESRYELKKFIRNNSCYF